MACSNVTAHAIQVALLFLFFHKRLCGPLAWRDRPDFTCFQAGSELAAIARGVAAELGPLKDTQAKPESGPFAKPK